MFYFEAKRGISGINRLWTRSYRMFCSSIRAISSMNCLLSSTLRSLGGCVHPEDRGSKWLWMSWLWGHPDWIHQNQPHFRASSGQNAHAGPASSAKNCYWKIAASSWRVLVGIQPIFAVTVKRICLSSNSWADSMLVSPNDLFQTLLPSQDIRIAT